MTRSECRNMQAGSLSADKTCDDLGFSRCCDPEDRLCARPGTACPSEP